MAKRYTDEFRRDAVRMATASGLTRPQLSLDLGVGLSTLNKWVQQHQHDDLMSGPHEDVEMEKTRLRKEVRLLREEYPSWSSRFFRPFLMIAQYGICEDKHLSHNGGDGDLFLFSSGDELFVFGFQIRIVADCDHRWHKDGVP